MKRCTELSRASRSMFRVPRSLTRWLAIGSGIDTRKHTTARWKITSACLTAAPMLARSRTSAVSTLTWGEELRLERVPTEKSSSTVTSFDCASRSTRWLPTNPAPPVTRTRLPSIFTAIPSGTFDEDLEAWLARGKHRVLRSTMGGLERGGGGCPGWTRDYLEADWALRST